MGQRIDPKNQFSKKLARWTSIFWFFYMAWLSYIVLSSPQSALYAVYMGIIATGVMIINVVRYTRNSIMETMALTLLDKTKIELQLSGNKTADTEEESSGEEEGGSG